MNQDDADDLINNLISLSNGLVNLETFKQILIPNYTDANGNSYFHFLTEYSFKEFCLRNMKLNKKGQIFSFEKYKEIKKEYNQQIIFFIQTLLELNCDLFFVNNNNQSPLLLSINKKNYIISKEYLKILQNLGIYTNEDYHDFLDIIIKNGNCFDNDCLELINLILTNFNEVIDNNIEAHLNKLSTYLITLCNNYSKNIYEKYNETIKIVSLDYIEQDGFNNISVKQDKQHENIIQEIKEKSIETINEYINKNFLPLILNLLKLGANIEYQKESGFIYLMSYPFFDDLPKFVKENHIDIYFQDKKGNIPLTHLINNKEYILQISKDIYDSTFKYLLDNINKDIKKSNINKGKSIFYTFLIKDCFEEAKYIYYLFKNSDDSNFNSLILQYILENKNPDKINSFIEIFKDVVDFNLFNIKQKRSIIHYICLYLSDNTNIKIFTELFSFIDKLKIEYLLKDKYERNFLFYLFLDQNENNKMNDPIEYLTLIFKKYKFNNLNEKDIFGNNLLFYAIQSKASKCIDLLLDNGIIITNEQNDNENSIFSICLVNKNINLFYYLYDKIKDPSIFNHKIYEKYKSKDITKYEDVDLDINIDDKKGETLYDFLNKYNFDEINKNNNNYINNNRLNNNNISNNTNNFNNILKNNNNNINNYKNNYINNNIINNYNTTNNNNLNPRNSTVNNQYFNQDINNYNNNNLSQVFNFFNFLNDDVLIFLNYFIKDIIITININNSTLNIKENISFQLNPIINDFIKNYEDYINNRKNSKRKIISPNLIRYSLSNNYEDIVRFSFNEKYNLITICNELILVKRFKDVSDCFLRILSQNNNDQTKLLNLIDEKGQTIYHLLPLVQDNLYLCKKLENHTISKIYDIEGNTPIFNACKNFDINFIETFSHYSFDLENQENNVNYELFLETKNSKTPLEALYEKLNKNNNNILKLIIDISINSKRIEFIPLIKYLIKNYHPYDNKIFKLNYRENLNSKEYIEKIIGLYQFYTKDLKGNIMIKDESGNDPFFICSQNNNYDFMFNVLIEENNISLNSTNNEGKSIIHQILFSNDNKKILLKKALESGFDFNIKDNDGMLPLDYAISQGDNEIINILKEHYKNAGIDIKENNNINNNIKPKLNFDYNKDSDTFYNESILVSMNIDKSENLNGLVSPMFKYDPLLSFYQVCLDEESSLPFSVNLVKKNFNFNLNNINMGYDDKKFCIQIIKDLNKDDEYLTITVDNFDLKTYTFRDFKSAQQKFKDLFKEVTANDWDNVKYNKLNFKTDYNKYYIFDYTYEEENAIYEYLKITIKNLYIKHNIEYKNKKIKNLIYYLLVKSYQNKFSIDENTLNVEQNTKNIIQKYKSTAVMKAASILLELKKLLNTNIKDDIYFRKRNYLINSYNDLIPYSKQRKNLNEFNDSINIDNEISRLTNYYYIDNVLKIFLGAIYNLNNIHPLDYIINSLGCKIQKLPNPQNDDINDDELKTEAEYIYNYINFTNGAKVPITAIYKIIESLNDKNFNLNNYENRYLFFHGTKVENVIGILSQGLKIAPVEAINTGKSYGTGIYLADCFSCSLNYCTYRGNLSLNNKNKRFMFMAEVAVGNIGYDADTYITNMGMNFDDYYMTKDGCRIFKTSNKTRCRLGVIVAHEETNVRIRYLIEI